METASLQSPPSVKSFSCSWRVDSSPSPYDHDDCSFIEMDPRLPPSKRFFRDLSSDHFCFDFPASDESPLGLVGAGDELMISNAVGFVMPLFVKSDRFDASHVVSISRHKKRVRCGPLRKCQMVSKRFLEKCVFKYLLRPFLCRRRRDDMNVNMRVKWELSAATGSPRTSLAYSSADDNWRRSCDSESSIYEAVLHCKKNSIKVIKELKENGNSRNYG